MIFSIFRWTAALLVVGLAPSFSQATPFGPSPCFEAAVLWIEDLPHAPDPRTRKILLSHSRSSCRSADYWLKNLAPAATSSQRRRTCIDLVLIWTHKECMYFRDTLHAPAYEPCKRWSRQMHKRCMEGEKGWFRESSAGDADADG